MIIGLVIPANIRYSPYVKYYTDILKREKVDFRLLSWDKSGINESVDMAFSYKTSDFNRGKILIGHFLFSLKCRQYIRKEKIDQLIIFTIAPLFFLGYGFLKKYQQKIMIDIRDDSPFRSKFPQRLIRIGNLSHTLVVSSPYYAEWFFKDSCLCHNVDQTMIEDYETSYGKYNIGSPTSLVFAGMMIEERANISLIRALADDNNFKLVYIGRDNEGKEKIKQYVNNHHIQNVQFEGEYKKEDIVRIYRKDADLINIFRENTLVNRNALPNKLYDAVLAGIPVAVYSHNAAIANYVKQFNLGVILDEQKNIKDQLLNYIHSYNRVEYIAGRDHFIELVKKDIGQFENQLKDFCRG